MPFSRHGRHSGGGTGRVPGGGSLCVSASLVGAAALRRAGAAQVHVLPAGDLRAPFADAVQVGEPHAKRRHSAAAAGVAAAAAAPAGACLTEPQAHCAADDALARDAPERKKAARVQRLWRRPPEVGTTGVAEISRFEFRPRRTPEQGAHKEAQRRTMRICFLPRTTQASVPEGPACWMFPFAFLCVKKRNGGGRGAAPLETTASGGAGGSAGGRSGQERTRAGPPSRAGSRYRTRRCSRRRGAPPGAGRARWAWALKKREKKCRGGMRPVDALPLRPTQHAVPEA